MITTSAHNLGSGIKPLFLMHIFIVLFILIWLWVENLCIKVHHVTDILEIIGIIKVVLGIVHLLIDGNWRRWESTEFIFILVLVKFFAFLDGVGIRSPTVGAVDLIFHLLVLEHIDNTIDFRAFPILHVVFFVVHTLAITGNVTRVFASIVAVIILHVIHDNFDSVDL